MTFEEKLYLAETALKNDIWAVEKAFIKRAAKVRPDTKYLLKSRYERAKELFAHKNGK